MSEASGRDPVEDYEVILKELENFSEELTDKTMIVAATKIDVAQDPERLKSLQDHCRRQEVEVFPISAVTGEGLDALLRELSDKVREARKTAVEAA